MTWRMTLQPFTILVLAGIIFVSPTSAASGDASENDHGNTSNSTAEVHETHSHHHPHETLVFLFGAIVLGTAMIHLTSHPWLQGLPTTVVIFVLGIILALIAESGFWDESGMLIRSYNSWVAIDPHLLLFAFLPPLLMGDAMAIDTHVAKKTAFQCLILAGPGVVMGSFATAAVLYGMLPYGWDFSLSLTVGSILAATDPVAVVSLLKDLGASPVLTMQIQGESLLNDGTAIVLFTIAYEVVSGKATGVAYVIGFLAKSTLGASLVGILIGEFFFQWIRLANDKLNHSSSIIQICLTFAVAYWSFLFSEGVLHMSGVLSTVSSSLVLAHKVWPVLVSQHSMHDIWHVVETVGNVLVFFLGGVLTGKQLPRRPAEEYGWVFAVFILMVLIRFVMFIILWPILNRAGRPVTFFEILVMTWGGLRGMVGLALAILVNKDRADGQISELDGDRILFLVGGVAALTLLINATTAPALCTALGITEAPDERVALLRNVARLARGAVVEMLDEMEKDSSTANSCSIGVVRETLENLYEKVIHHLPAVSHGHGEIEEPTQPLLPQGRKSHRPSVLVQDAIKERQSTRLSRAPTTTSNGFNSMRKSRVSTASASVAQHASKHRRSLVRGLFKHEEEADVEELWSRFELKRRLLLEIGAEVRAFQFGSQMADIKDLLGMQQIDIQQLRLVREAFLEAVRADYWEQLQKGKIVGSTDNIHILLNSINLAKEKSGQALSDWEMLSGEMGTMDVKLNRMTRMFATPQEGSKEKEDSNQAFEKTLRKAATAIMPVHTENEKQEPTKAKASWLSRQLEQSRISRNFQQQMHTVQIVGSFVEAHEHAQTQIASYFGEDESVDSPEEAFVIIESQVEIFEALIYRNAINKTVQKKVNTWWHIHQLLEHYRSFVLQAVEHGVLHTKEGELLIHPISEIVHQSNKERTDFNSGAKLTRTDAAVMIQRTFRKHRARMRLINTVKARRSQMVTDLAPPQRVNPPMPGQLNALAEDMVEEDLL